MGVTELGEGEGERSLLGRCQLTHSSVSSVATMTPHLALMVIRHF